MGVRVQLTEILRALIDTTNMEEVTDNNCNIIHILFRYSYGFVCFD